MSLMDRKNLFGRQEEIYKLAETLKQCTNCYGMPEIMVKDTPDKPLKFFIKCRCKIKTGNAETPEKAVDDWNNK